MFRSNHIIYSSFHDLEEKIEGKPFFNYLMFNYISDGLLDTEIEVIL
jgi:hypothetical protein